MDGVQARVNTTSISGKSSLTGILLYIMAFPDGSRKAIFHESQRTFLSALEFKDLLVYFFRLYEIFILHTKLIDSGKTINCVLRLQVEIKAVSTLFNVYDLQL